MYRATPVISYILYRMVLAHPITKSQRKLCYNDVVYNMDLSPPIISSHARDWFAATYNVSIEQQYDMEDHLPELMLNNMYIPAVERQFDYPKNLHASPHH